MGTSKRYAEAIDRRMDERILERVMRDNEPATLTPTELELNEEPLTRAPRPQPVVAWVRYGTTPVSVIARPSRLRCTGRAESS